MFCFVKQDGKKLTGDARVKISSQGNRYVLQVREATTTDGGKYEVVGLNSAGEARCECEVVITEPTSLQKPKQVGQNEIVISKGLEEKTVVDEGGSTSLAVLVTNFGKIYMVKLF